MIPLFLISLGPPNFPITGSPGIPPTSQPASTFGCNPSYRQSTSEPISHPPKVPRFPGIRLTDKSQSVLSDHLHANIQELREEYRFHFIVSAVPPVKVKFDFCPPSLEDGFLERVFKDNVSLQRAYFDPLRLSVIGDTQVTSSFYEKKVSAVCTWNNWVCPTPMLPHPHAAPPPCCPTPMPPHPPCCPTLHAAQSPCWMS